LFAQSKLHAQLDELVLLVDANEEVENAREHRNAELEELLKAKKNDVVQVKRYLQEHNTKANAKVSSSSRIWGRTSWAKGVSPVLRCI
jgi:hypothetical protein